MGVQLHHHFASRFLIDSLHQHGFCCSYRELPSKSSTQVYTSVNKPKHSMYSQLPPKMSLLRGNKCWSAFTMGDLGNTLTLYATSDSVRRWLPIPVMFSLRLYHPLQLQQNTTASVYTFRSSSGKALGMIFRHWNGGGKKAKEDLPQYTLTCLQLQKSSYG